ncbi:HIT family protein [Nesterenkonia aurantiaca]|uniref:HIT family protein n=1 Tax=Nesterenkonia aurantiaca TaxID=1436010 RepID=UPI003EE7E009
MSNCIFCEILYGTAEAKTVFNGISTLGIVPLNPVTPGHVIFMPRKHVRDFAEDSAVSAAVMNDVAVYADVVSRRNLDERSDFNIITSAGPAATQSVYHLHVHYVPRKTNDGLYLPWTRFQSEGQIA